MATQLTDAQQKQIAQWAAEGLGLSDLQKRINAEFALHLTFMDVRLLMLDLKLELKDRKPAAAANVDLAKGAKGKDRHAQETPAEELPDSLGGGVTVDIDRIKKPGALVSGSVKFSDGMRGKWMLDQFGRLALDMDKTGYRPNPSDLQDFQAELSRLLQSRGY